MIKPVYWKNKFIRRMFWILIFPFIIVMMMTLGAFNGACDELNYLSSLHRNMWNGPRRAK